MFRGGAALAAAFGFHGPDDFADRAVRATVAQAMRSREAFLLRLQLAGADADDARVRALWDLLGGARGCEPRAALCALQAVSDAPLPARIRAAQRTGLPAAAAAEALFARGAELLLALDMAAEPEALRDVVRRGGLALSPSSTAAKEWWAAAAAPAAAPVAREYAVELPVGRPVRRKVVLRTAAANSAWTPLRAVSSCPAVVRVRHRGHAKPGGAGDDYVLRLVFLAHADMQMRATVTLVDDAGVPAAAVAFNIRATNSVAGGGARARVDGGGRRLFVDRLE